MAPQLSFEIVASDVLLEKVRSLKALGYRLVQIGATRLPGEFELTYSFDREAALVNLRLVLPGHETKVPSITSVFWSAFLYENELHDLFGLEPQGLAVDFHGNLYRTSVKFPFGSTKPPSVKPAAPGVARADKTDAGRSVASNSHP